MFNQAVGGRIPLAGSANILLISLLVLAGGIFIVARGIPLLSLPAGRPMALLLLVGLLAAYRSGSTMLSASEWVPVLAAFVAYSLAAYLFDTPQALQRVLDVIGVSFVVPAAIGFYQLISGEGTRALGVAAPRVLGTFVHPNAFGFYLVIVLAVFLVQSLTHSGRRKIVALFGAGAAGVLLIGTFTRIAWAGALVVVLIVALTRKRALLIAVPVVALLILGLVPSVAERLADPFGGSFADRFTKLWPATIGEWMRVTAAEPTALLTMVRRVTGLGPGMDMILAEQGGYFRSSPAHNDYLRMLVDYGVFGLLMFVIVLGVIAVYAYRVWRDAAMSDRLLSGVALTFFAISLAFPLMSVTDNVFGYTSNQVYFWTLAGLAVRVRHLTRKNGIREEGSFPTSHAVRRT
jgi:O-antigen ligase